MPIAAPLAIPPDLTPAVIADSVLLVGSAIGRCIINWVVSLSHTWLAGPWEWCVPVIMLFVWWRRRPVPRAIETESEDHLTDHLREHQMSHQPPMQLIPGTDDSPKCQASAIWRRGDPAEHLISDPLKENGVFNNPLAGGVDIEKLIEGAPTKSAHSIRACLFRDKHVAVYHSHVRQCMCQTPKFFQIGIPFPADTGVLYECISHRKERIVTEQAAMHQDLKIGKKPRTPPKEDGIPPYASPRSSWAVGTTGVSNFHL